jgi:hypothetical protein
MNLTTLIYAFLALLTHKTLDLINQTKNTPEKIDVSGHWEGTITRDEGGGRRTTYTMDLDINQKGKSINGISYVHYDDGTKLYHAKMAVSGKISGSYVKYLETKLLRSDSIPDTEWCVKKADLIHRIKDTQPTLEGIWEGVTSLGGCVPGRIFLQKKPPKV